MKNVNGLHELTDNEIECGIRDFANMGYLRFTEMVISDLIKGAKWYREELRKHNTFSGQPTPDLCCGMYEEPPLELKICTHCNKEFKSNIDCPVCPSCYL